MEQQQTRMETSDRRIETLLTQMTNTNLGTATDSGSGRDDGDVCTGSYYSHMTLLGTGCVNARTMHVECGFLETHRQNAAVQFLPEMAKSVSCVWTF